MVGSIAGLLTTGAFVPQVIKVIKTKDTKALSLSMYLLQVIGITLWLVHGVIISDFALIGANGITLCLSLIILVYKIIYK